MTPGTKPWEGGLLPSTGALRPKRAGEPAVSVAGYQTRGRGKRTGRKHVGVGNNKLLHGSEGSRRLIFNDK